MGTAFSALIFSNSLPRFIPTAAPAATLEGSVALGVPVEECREVCLQPETHSYPVEGYFTGVHSSVVVPQESDAVFNSLSRDIQRIFGPIAECKDDLKESDGRGWERLRRRVQIPFSISYFCGNINLEMEVENNRPLGQISFKSTSQGRFLSKFRATFHVSPTRGPDGSENTHVQLDSRLIVKRLPPYPLKGLVKGVVVKKMNRCMQDLADFHAGGGLAWSPDRPQLANNIQPTASLRRMLSTERRSERPSIL